MKITTTLLIGILITVFSFSCKKKNSDPEPTATPAPAPAGTPTYGHIRTTHWVWDYVSMGLGTAIDSMVSARFFESPSSSGVLVNAGTITLNGVTLVNSSNVYSQPGSPIINISTVQNWNVAGSGTVSAFSHSYSPSYPKYTGGNLLPDTCIKSNGITVNVTGVSNSSAALVSIYQGTVTITKVLNNSTGTLNFTPTEIAALTINSFIQLEVSFTKYHQQAFGSISHTFYNDFVYRKYTYLK